MKLKKTRLIFARWIPQLMRGWKTSALCAQIVFQASLHAKPAQYLDLRRIDYGDGPPE
jgi:hypothetical protein